MRVCTHGQLCLPCRNPWRSEVEIRELSQLLSTVIFEAVSLTGPPCLFWLDWLTSQPL